MDLDWSLILGGVSLLLAIIGIIVAYTIYRKQKTTKEINITSLNYIIFEKNDNLPEIKIMVEEIIVDEAKLFEFNIKNIGNKAIEVTDFKNPIEINFNDDAYILTATPVEKSDKFIDPIIKINGASLQVSPVFLNPEDDFSINIIINNYKKHKINGKIKDGSIVVGQKRNKYTILSIQFGLVVLVIMALTGMYNIFRDPSSSLGTFKYVFVEAFIALLFVFAPAFWDINYRENLFKEL